MAHPQQDSRRLELDLALHDSDPLRLLSIHQSDRALVEGNERASLSIVAALRQLGRREEERGARERRLGKETRKDAWLFLDAEALVEGGRFYESQGSLRLARFEFASALAIDPSDRGLREQAGDFLFRAGARESAIGVWASEPSGRLSGTLWLKSWCWRRVLKPSAEPIAAPAEAGELAPFVAMLQGFAQWGTRERVA